MPAFAETDAGRRLAERTEECDACDAAVELLARQQMGEAALAYRRRDHTVVAQFIQQGRRVRRLQWVARAVQHADVRRQDGDADLIGEDAVHDVDDGEHLALRIAQTRGQLRIAYQRHFDLQWQRGARGDGFQLRHQCAVLIQRRAARSDFRRHAAEVVRDTAFSVRQSIDECSRASCFGQRRIEEGLDCAGGRDRVKIRAVPEGAEHLARDDRESNPRAGKTAEAAAIQRFAFAHCRRQESC